MEEYPRQGDPLRLALGEPFAPLVHLAQPPFFPQQMPEAYVIQGMGGRVSMPLHVGCDRVSHLVQRAQGPL